ncbi:MAG: hypothetical protein ACP5NS_00005, partial [Candidatus Pacearchaeota archaeon]
IAGTNPVSQWNLSTLEANSCLNSSGIVAAGGAPQIPTLFQLLDANTTATGRIGCSIFPYEGSRDTLRLDFNLTIPENSLTGALGNVITAVVSAI